MKINLTSWQHQVVCGALLGSGYISRTNPTYMGMSETRSKQWLLYKSLELSSVGAMTPISDSGNVFKWRSQSGEIWNDYGKCFYRNGSKYIEMQILDQLKDIALAIWFGDKGFWYSNRRVGLRTTAFRSNNDIIWQYFNEVGMSCERKRDSHGAVRIVFDKEGTLEFLSAIGHRLPEFMHSKLYYPS